MADYNRIQYKGFEVHEAYDPHNHRQHFWVQHPVTGAGIPCDDIEEVQETIDDMIRESQEVG